MTADVVVVGSGIVGTAVADRLIAAGHTVEVLEKGPGQIRTHLGARSRSPVDEGTAIPSGQAEVTMSGSYRHHLTGELVQRAGGMATTWRGIALRMRPVDFMPRRAFGRGRDWPIGYDDLEPWYGRAEGLLGVAGTDEDNPFAPTRSTPHPLPPIGLSTDDRLLAGRLAQHGITLSTTPQAITSVPYDGRPGCTNIGPTCNTCPTGARYSPTHHLDRIVATGRCTLRTDTTVRRILTDGVGAVRALVVRGPDGIDIEQPARVVVLAAGAVETARLLLLSTGRSHPDGLGNDRGLVGQGLTFHHMYGGRLRYRDALYPGQVAPMTGQSHQFLDPAEGGGRLGMKVEFSSHLPNLPGRHRWTSADDVLADMRDAIRSRNLGLHAETQPGPGKHISLSSRKDPHGDPLAHVHYQADDVDRETHAWGRRVAERIAVATGASEVEYRGPDDFHSVFHHMGTARMGDGPHDGVADDLGRVHGTPGLFVLGGALFPTATPLNPTLTMVALALRAAPAVHGAVRA